MTEANQDILVHTAAGVSSITFQRVAKKNAITSAMYAALADALAAAQADAGFTGAALSARHRDLCQTGGRLGLRPGGGHRHHHAAALRSGLCRRQRAVLDAVREPGPVPRGGIEPAAATTAGLPARGRGAAAGRAFHGRY